MLDLYNIIINDPVYIMIAVILAIAVVLSIVEIIQNCRHLDFYMCLGRTKEVFI